MRLLAITLAASVCAAAGAQIYSPAHFTNVRATGSNAFPFGSGTQFRYAQIHDDVNGPVAVNMISTRRAPATSATAGGTANVDLWVSTAATSSATPNIMFDLNHGADKAQVITNKAINIATATADALPGNYDVVMPFDTPFPFTSGSLCWEVHVLSRTASVTNDNFSTASTNPALGVHSLTTFRPGCIATGRTARQSATGSSVMTWASGTGILRITGSNAAANAIIITAVGTSNTSWGGIPLPFLIPGSDTAPSGSCFLYNDAFLFQAGLASATGASTTDVAIPATPNLHGLTTRTQNYSIDAPANPIGIVTSNPVIHQWIAPFGTQPASRIYLSNSLGGTATGTQVGGGNCTKFN